MENSHELALDGIWPAEREGRARDDSRVSGVRNGMGSGSAHPNRRQRRKSRAERIMSPSLDILGVISSKSDSTVLL